MTKHNLGLSYRHCIICTGWIVSGKQWRRKDISACIADLLLTSCSSRRRRPLSWLPTTCSATTSRTLMGEWSFLYLPVNFYTILRVTHSSVRAMTHDALRLRCDAVKVTLHCITYKIENSTTHSALKRRTATATSDKRPGSEANRGDAKRNSVTLCCDNSLSHSVRWKNSVASTQCGIALRWNLFTILNQN